MVKKIELDDVIGLTSGKLTVIGAGRYSKRQYIRTIALCECGGIANPPLHKITNKKAIACKKCTSNINSMKGYEARNLAVTKHGLSKHPLYDVWCNMKKRCYNSNSPDYQWYGERGIIVCDEWKDDFQAFYDWCISNGWQEGLEIDREDNNGNYDPCNCRCILHRDNTRNRSSSVLDLKLVSLVKGFYKKYYPKNEGQMTLSELARLLGISRELLNFAIHEGYPDISPYTSSDLEILLKQYYIS